MRGDMTAGLVSSVTLDVDGDETGLAVGFDITGALDGLNVGFDVTGALVGLGVGFDVTGALDGLNVGAPEGALVGLGVGLGVEIGGEGRAGGWTPALTVLSLTSQAHGQAFIISATSATCKPMAKSM